VGRNVRKKAGREKTGLGYSSGLKRTAAVKLLGRESQRQALREKRAGKWEGKGESVEGKHSRLGLEEKASERRDVSARLGEVGGRKGPRKEKGRGSEAGVCASEDAGGNGLQEGKAEKTGIYMKRQDRKKHRV